MQVENHPQLSAGLPCRIGHENADEGAIAMAPPLKNGAVMGLILAVLPDRRTGGWGGILAHWARPAPTMPLVHWQRLGMVEDVVRIPAALDGDQIARSLPVVGEEVKPESVINVAIRMGA